MHEERMLINMIVYGFTLDWKTSKTLSQSLYPTQATIIEVHETTT